MSAPARLTALRLVGFKSFAERTSVEFGPGISAVVGPNGSGKSNLADALRWTLGEAGRSLRTRRAEDVIFAGSSARRAVGMADVTLVIDNADRLLPVDYGEVELGRRLYRSGDNEYLLNRQRVRLRDLIELLDAGNLADNAFLFIGQGMVDQALALRPEERRPLFEEAAGVRRHERRRRHAEAELGEAEANLERLRDVLAELRPQARRLAAQAEQLHARQTAGLELAQALVAAARARWVGSAGAAATAQSELDAAHAAADRAMSELRAAEEQAEAASRDINERAEEEQRRRDSLEQVRGRSVELRLRHQRSTSDLEAVTRETARLAQERAAIEARSAAARVVLAGAQPANDDAAADALVDLERELARLEQSIEQQSRASAGKDEAAQKAARDAADQAAAAERARRRVAEADRRLVEAQANLKQADEAASTAIALRDDAVEQLATAVRAVEEADAAADAARRQFESAAAADADRQRARADAGGRREALAARLEEVESALASTVGSDLLRAARARGGSLAAEGLEVDQRLAAAVAAALGDAARGIAVGEGDVIELAQRSGVLIVAGERSAATRSRGHENDARRVLAAAAARDGGSLSDAVRRDPQGHVTRLLSRVAWAPDLARALEMRAELPVGWAVATVAGELVTDTGVVRLAGASGFIGQRAERDELVRSLDALDATLPEAEREASRARAAAEGAAAAREAARAAAADARRRLRLAEETERVAQRRADAALRERAWQSTQADRAEREAAEAAAASSALDAVAAESAPARPQPVGAGGPVADPDSGLRDRLRALRADRERLLASRREAAARRAAVEDERRRAQLTLAFDEARTVELDARAQELAGREAELRSEVEQQLAQLATATEAERAAREDLAGLLAGGADARGRLQAAERAGLAARERLRAAEVRSRAAEVRSMEARLHVEQVREQLLVELAGIGADGLAALRGTDAAGEASPSEEPPSDELGTALEEALEAALPRWQSEAAPGEVPGAGRLAALRRRFHELGATNPFAVEEYAEVRSRLEAMEEQRADLENAIAATRQLIANLSGLITTQFRQTFAALEGAFARRFEQLFGGGEAQLSLTAPEDLSATGVEITARPPGKRRQPLAMLSGGERALTAVALLLAMLEVRPVPFCVLDEVDAALDEANIARFSSALRGLADRIQFIVITHNRGTIEAADALYGVTIGEDAVSRIVSLRLTDALDERRAPQGLAAAAVADG